MIIKILSFSILLIIISTSCTQKDNGNHDQQDFAKLDGSSFVASQLPEGKKWRLVWHDEFEGVELDTGKWDYRLHLMQMRHETWTEEGVELDGKGNLLLKLIEKDGDYFSSQLQTGRNYL
ncbi:MAG: hypothetical protein KFF73_00820, partial [Cyclobacteriaceae bacterium]|nr:hypothetical protein [Cyclobacteriaceae bacterium]